MKKRLSKKTILIISILVAVLILIIATVAYLLIFKKGATYFGFTVPDFTAGATLGDTIGNAANANVWDNTKLNPFGNEA